MRCSSSANACKAKDAATHRFINAGFAEACCCVTLLQSAFDMQAVLDCSKVVACLILLRGAGPRLRRQPCNAHEYSWSVQRHLRLSTHWTS
jgi:hypothetical protein